jgi:hypothetical protein
MFSNRNRAVPLLLFSYSAVGLAFSCNISEACRSRDPQQRELVNARPNEDVRTRGRYFFNALITFLWIFKLWSYTYDTE